MSSKKRIGKRERAARKRFKGHRTVVNFGVETSDGPGRLTLKLGRKKLARFNKNYLPF